MHAMRQDRAGNQRAQRRKPLQRTVEAARPRVIDVGQILRDMHMQDGAEFAGESARLAHGVVGDGEARVQADHAAHQRRGWNAAALGQTARGLLAPEIALGRAVAKQRAHAELLADLGENGERALDQIRRFVVIDQRGGAGEQRARDIVLCRRAQRFGVERTVEPPPHPLEDLHEIFRRRRGRRHAVARQARCRDACARKPRRRRSRHRRRRARARLRAATPTIIPSTTAIRRP